MTETLAGKLVRAFGDVDRMAAMYAPNITWSLPASLTFYPRPMVGKEAVTKFNRHIWGQVYRPDCSVQILDESGDETVSAARFIYRAYHIGAKLDYENEYTVFVRSDAAGIIDVNEAFDTAALVDLLAGQEIGKAFQAALE